MKPDSPPVGVLAKTQNLAKSLAQELGIKNAVLMSQGSTAGRGMRMRAIVVDESAWPLTEQTRLSLLPCLDHHKGYLLHVERYDPVREL